MKFIKLRVAKNDSELLEVAERYIRPERITEIRMIRVQEDSRRCYRYEFVLDNGEIAWLEWENYDINEALILLMK